MTNAKLPVCLTIAGLDPSGGAGVIADIKTFTAFGCFGTAAITSLTYQNTVGVFGAEHQSADCVRRQVLPVIEDLGVDSVKTGMLPTVEVIVETAQLIADNRLRNIVVDPVVRSTSGFDLINGEALSELIRLLFPLSNLVTPNIPETERITGISIESEIDLDDAADVIRSMGAKNVLIKGGHFDRDQTAGGLRIARDRLYTGNGKLYLDAEYIDTTATHGTGCTLAAAVAANLAQGRGLVDSVRIAKEYVDRAIRTPTNLGNGSSPIGFPRN
ncbi:MAG: bifunctional hydroxymethylpyrimidine kinase/phosphomethylpyrimidine kinase [Acidobacteriota bacterium]